MRSIASRLTKPVVLTAGGGSWRILINHRVLLDIEELTGTPAMSVNLSLLSARMVRAVLFSVLREAGSGLSIEDAGRMMTPADLESIRSSLIEAWQASMPEPTSDSSTAGEDEKQEVRKPLSTMNAWAEARFDLQLSEEEWLSMTPRMLRALSDRRRQGMFWRELMNASLCAHTVNSSYHAPKPPTQPRAYLLHNWPGQDGADDDTPRTVYGEELMAIFADMPKTKVN